MSRHPELYQWIDTVVMRFPSLSKPQAMGLALWSFGMVIARSCSLTAVADVLASLMGQSSNTLHERLRDTFREADAKAVKYQRCVSRWHCTSCLESFKGIGETRLEPGMAGVVETVSRSFTRRLDGHHLGGSWLIREVVV